MRTIVIQGMGFQTTVLTELDIYKKFPNLISLFQSKKFINKQGYATIEHGELVSIEIKK